MKKIGIILVILSLALMVGCQKDEESMKSGKRVIVEGEYEEEIAAVDKESNNTVNTSDIEVNENNNKVNTNDDSGVVKKEDSKEVSNKLQSKKQSYIDRLNQLEYEDNKVQEGYGSGELCTADYVTGTEDVYNKYDNLLNEIYSDLKSHLSTSEMSKLKEVQIEWIGEKEKTKEDILRNEPGAHANWVMIALNNNMSERTEKRCYELLEYFN